MVESDGTPPVAHSPQPSRPVDVDSPAASSGTDAPVPTTTSEAVAGVTPQTTTTTIATTTEQTTLVATDTANSGGGNEAEVVNTGGASHDHSSSDTVDTQTEAVLSHPETAETLDASSPSSPLPQASGEASVRPTTTTTPESTAAGTAATAASGSMPRWHTWRTQAAAHVSTTLASATPVASSTVQSLLASARHHTTSSSSNTTTTTAVRTAATGTATETAATATTTADTVERSTNEELVASVSNDNSTEKEGSRQSYPDESDDGSELSESSRSYDVSSAGSTAYDDGIHTTSIGGGGVVGGAATAARARVLPWAASMVDSVRGAGRLAPPAATLFRGRYTATTPPTSTSTPTTTTTPPTTTRRSSPATQAARIRASPAADHWQALHQSLLPHQYGLLLGRGRLGVNLKQCYGRHAGVYTDYAVPGGAAATSGLVQPGDVVVAVGDGTSGTSTANPTNHPRGEERAQAVYKGTIATVPEAIARAARPVLLVLATSGVHASGSEQHTEKSAAMLLRNVNHVDVVVALLYAALQKQSANRQKDSEADGGERDDDSEDTDDAFGEENDAPRLTGVALEEHIAEMDAILNLVVPNPMVVAANSSINPPSTATSSISPDDFLDSIGHPEPPSMSLRQACVVAAAQRNPMLDLDDPNRGSILMDLAASTSVTAALSNALLLCFADGRRWEFLDRYVQEHEMELNKQGRTPMNYAKLSLFRDMLRYSNLYHTMRPFRRRQFAQSIAHRYVSPSISLETGVLQPPPQDVHAFISDATLRSLESALESEDDLPRTLMLDLQRTTLNGLLESEGLGFFTSTHCARMRAYLRHTEPFRTFRWKALRLALDPSVSGTETRRRATNIVSYSLVYLMCRMDVEGFGEHDDIFELDQTPRARVVSAACGVCAALFLRTKLLVVLVQAQKESRSVENDHSVTESTALSLLSMYEQFWEIFVAPGVGALHLCSGESADYVEPVRSALQEVQSVSQTIDRKELVSRMIDVSLQETLQTMADEFFYEYAANLYPKFQLHKFHEWMCAEMAKAAEAANSPAANDSTNKDESDALPDMPPGCIKRLLRNATFPVGVTPHKPCHTPVVKDAEHEKCSDGSKKFQQISAECGVVFGTSVGLDLAAQMAHMSIDEQSDIRRYSCQSLVSNSGDYDSECFLSPEAIPPTLESYTSVPLGTPKPFSKYTETMSSWQSIDGWAASIISFMIPRADATTDDGEDAALYGVTLILQQRTERIQTYNASTKSRVSFQSMDGESTKDPMVCWKETDDGALQQIVNIKSMGSEFNTQMSKRSWLDRLSKQAQSPDSTAATIGLALVSQRNVVLSMKETLLMLLQDFTTCPGKETTNLSCDGLVNLLGNFAHQDIESNSLLNMLEPYLSKCAKPWLERPLNSQKESFLAIAGDQLLQSLPPTPLALLLVVALLEQKIVLSSSRRSLLFSVSTALGELLKPLKWCHLLVPRVPASLADDLLQYPAPFILGMPSDDPGIMDLIKELPNDVTLVDLDVGRVILASSFAHDAELGRRGVTDKTDDNGALRSQVLYLAQSLGGVFGARLDPQTWCCDLAVRNSGTQAPTNQASRFSSLRTVCNEFIEELLAGSTSCCYWIEESLHDAASGSAVAPTVLFDEDRFFQIKNSREKDGFNTLFGADANRRELALALDDFDLVVELFLRCQSMNEYVGTRDRDEMVYSM